MKSIFNRIFSIAAGAIIFFIILNAYIITKDKADLRKIGNAVKYHAEKSGGFTSQTEDLFFETLREKGLKDKLKEIIVRPGPGGNVKVQKREMFEFEIIYKGEVLIPFADNIEYESSIPFRGYSHKYHKP